MKRILLGLGCLAGIVLVSAGCQLQHTPHLYNPLHLERHFLKIFSPTDGELHMFHVDIDRVVFGIDNYEELERTEYIYSE